MKKVIFLKYSDVLIDYLHTNSIEYKVQRTIEALYIEIGKNVLTDKQLYQINKLNRKLW
tara:strand:+ start:2569 stop:2745 length:177 start_codon:yes stop_codon:yes gene_type:complete